MGRARSETGNSFPTTFSSVWTVINSGTTEHTSGESVIINNHDFVILLVSHDVINTGEFIKEDLDNSFSDFDVIGESFDFTHVEFSVSGEFSLSFGNSGFSGIEVSKGGIFVFKGENEIVFTFGEISSLSILFDLESMDFFFGFLDISDGVSSGFNFSSDVRGLHLVKVEFEFIKFDH